MSSSEPLMSPSNNVTPDHRGPVVDVSIWIFFVLSGLSVVSKVLTKLARASSEISLRKLQIDDFVLSLTQVLALGTTISISRQVAAGLGTPLETLSEASIAGYEKAAYASQLLYVCALCAANSAAIIFGLMLQPSKNHQLYLKATQGFGFVWLIVSIFGIAFQCKLPQPWALLRNQCFDQRAFWAFVEATNLATNFAITVVLIAIVWGLQMKTPKTKYLLALVFGTRSLLIIPVAFKLSYMFHRGLTHDTGNWNPTSDSVEEVILTSVIMNASIAIACLPFMKTLMESLQPGWSTGQVRPGVGYDIMVTKTFENSSYPLSGLSR
ncbi:hypothetical protein CC78DRAFT_614733 [Lojkania enalia]|uniref:Rhodopsin domain-containing protein n=1 Tax=Lojkania enalia TaxID=147567 RepID=A0A9P4KFV3_9PLEO|nr:hypothetical protein CC78DRAFT_614733 [Didymosphaeria enalia]